MFLIALQAHKRGKESEIITASQSSKTFRQQSKNSWEINDNVWQEENIFFFFFCNADVIFYFNIFVPKENPKYQVMCGCVKLYYKMSFSLTFPCKRIYFYYIHVSIQKMGYKGFV